MVLATVLCAVSLVFVIFNVDPFVDSGVGFLFFYASLFLTFLGLFTLIAFLISRALPSSRMLPIYKRVKGTFYTGFFAALICTFGLFLQGSKLLSLANSSILLGIVIFAILFKYSIKLHKNQKRGEDHNHE